MTQPDGAYLLTCSNSLLCHSMGLRGPKKGTRLSEAHKQKLREARLFVPLTEAQKRSLRDAQERARIANTGRPRSQSTRLKISQSKVGKPLSPSHLESIRKANKQRLPLPNITPSEFNDRLLPIPESGCMLWEASAPRRGSLIFNGRRMLAYRVAWVLQRGPIPEGLFVCHHCDVPSCCNVDHLFLGKHRENAIDMVIKGRHVAAMKGKRPWNYGLTKNLDERVRKNGASVSKSLLGNIPWNKGLKRHDKM